MWIQEASLGSVVISCEFKSPKAGGSIWEWGAVKIYRHEYLYYYAKILTVLMVWLLLRVLQGISYGVLSDWWLVFRTSSDIWLHVLPFHTSFALAGSCLSHILFDFASWTTVLVYVFGILFIFVIWNSSWYTIIGSSTENYLGRIRNYVLYEPTIDMIWK